MEIPQPQPPRQPHQRLSKRLRLRLHNPELHNPLSSLPTPQIQTRPPFKIHSPPRSIQQHLPPMAQQRSPLKIQQHPLPNTLQPPPPQQQIIEVVYPLPNLRQINPANPLRQALQNTDANILQITMEDIQVIPNQGPPRPRQQMARQPQQRQSRKNWWVTGFVIGFILLISLSAVIGYFAIKERQNDETVPSEQNAQNQNQNAQNQDQIKEEQINYNTISQQYICRLRQNLCLGIPEHVMSYIFSTYSQGNSLKSVLQVSKSLALVEKVIVSAAPWQVREEFVGVYRNITRAVECMSYNLPNNYTEIFQHLTNIFFTTDKQIQTYLRMAQSFSGEPYKLLSQSDTVQACTFSVGPTNSSVRLLQQSNASCNVTDPRTVIYIDGTGYGPSSTVESLIKLRQVMAADSRLSMFVEDVVSMGAMRETNSLGFSDRVASSQLFYWNVTQDRQPKPNSTTKYKALQMIANRQRNIDFKPADVSLTAYVRMLNFSAQQTSNNMNQLTRTPELPTGYNILITRQYIIQQLNEGKRIAIVAHGHGALYANRLYMSLETAHKRSVSLVYIAPVCRSMPENYEWYVSNPKDLVVNYLQGVFRDNINHWYSYLNPLQPIRTNVNGTTQTGDTTGANHFLASYLYSYRGEFQQLMVRASKKHTLPGKLLGSGPITVNMVTQSTSSSQVDLHVFQPGDVHLYQYSKSGKFGFIDSNGSSTNQHYYTNCAIDPGNYVIKLNYHYGNSDLNVAIMVKAGSEYFVKKITLGKPAKSTTKAQAPIYVCTIRVQYNAITNSNQFSVFV